MLVDMANEIPTKSMSLIPPMLAATGWSEEGKAVHPHPTGTAVLDGPISVAKLCQ